MSPRSVLALRHALAILALATASLLGFSYQRFRSRAVEDVAAKVERKALTPRLAMIVLDGLRDDRFAALMPKTKRIAEERGTLAAVEAPPITFTIAGIYTLGTGDMPSHALIPDNFQAHAVRVDSLPAAVARSGGRTMLFGERLWQDLFGKWAAPSESERDRGPFAGHDEGVFAKLREALDAGACSLCVLHDAQVDALAHRGGVFAEDYARYLASVDERIAALGDKDITVFVTSDHGMLDSGGHGGDERAARASFLAAWGPGVRRTSAERLQQADVPTAAAVLLGAPIPFQSHGSVPTFVDVADRAAMDAEVTAQKHALAARLAQVHGGRAPDDRAALLAFIARIEAEAPRATMLLAIVPLLVALGGLAIAAGGRVRSRVLMIALPPIAFGWVFSNLLYHRVSYGVATMIAFAAALLPFAFVRRRATFIALVAAVFVAAETHWVAQLQMLLLGAATWFALDGRSRGVRLAGALGVAAVAFALVELAWAGGFALRSVNGLTARVAATVAAAVVAALVFGRGRPRPTAAFIAASAALAYHVAVTAPPFMRPWLPIAAMAALIALSPRGIAVSIFDVVAAGLVVLFAMQASPAYFVLLATAGVLCAQLLQVTTLDRHPWLRGAILLAVAYGVTVVEGNRLRFEDVHVLSGFLGGALELDLPITATLVASYYAAPIVVAIAVSRWTGETARRCRSTLRAAAMLCLAKIAAVLVGFAWGRLAEGSWSMQLTEVALLATWTVALLFAQVLLVPQRRERAATLLIDAPVESQR